MSASSWLAVPADRRWAGHRRQVASEAARRAGGLGIQAYRGQPYNPRTHFPQERIDGIPCSAVFVGGKVGTRLLGVTRQLIGTPWLNASPFHYAGNLGPLLLDQVTRSHWRCIGDALGQTFHLRGLFSVDAIERDGVPWPIEINPRYTASIELLERAFDKAFLSWHSAAIASSNPLAMDLAAPARIFGKAILYAHSTFAFPEHGPWLAALEAGADLDALDYADIPHAGEEIEQGQPVLTLFASATTVSDCEMRLQEKAATLARCLWP